MSVGSPREDIARTVTGIWATHLARDDISGDDDFFDLGGYSLAAVQILAQIAHVFHVEITMREFYERPLVNAIVDRLVHASAEDTARIDEEASRAGK
jgi:acyl carrier protein